MWDQCGTSVGSISVCGAMWDHLISIGSVWNQCGISVGSMWKQWCDIIGLVWDQCGISVGSMWDQVGISVISIMWHHRISVG